MANKPRETLSVVVKEGSVKVYDMRDVHVVTKTTNSPWELWKNADKQKNNGIFHAKLVVSPSTEFTIDSAHDNANNKVKPHPSIYQFSNFGNPKQHKKHRVRDGRRDKFKDGGNNPKGRTFMVSRDRAKKLVVIKRGPFRIVIKYP